MTCKACNGIGAVRGIEPDGSQGFVDCTCKREPETRAAWLLRQARIPDRYAGAEIATYETVFKSCTQTQMMAKMAAKKYIQEYPLLSNMKGLVLYGDYGTGKTHLLVGILKQMVWRYEKRCLYQDNQTLMRMLQSSHEQDDVTEHGVLKPILAAEVLALDDLGVYKLSEYRLDIMNYIIDTRYANGYHTIIATNYPFEVGGVADNAVERSTPKPTKLGDQIGERAFDRIVEMCIPVPVYGDSMRQGVKRATWD